ncbi:MAG: YheC/YheD family protein [Firmicutes bacterium]|nr:YheC/YheD family protein [Bacillota bacterium]
MPIYWSAVPGVVIMYNEKFNVTIKNATATDSTICLPADIRAKKEYKYRDQLKIIGGNSEIRVDVVESDNFGTINLNENHLHQLGLYINQQVSACFQSIDKIKIGPYIGVFVNIGSLNSLMKGTPYKRLLELIKASKEENAIVYFMSIRSINWPEMRISAYSYNFNDNLWELKKFPFPDVIYDRGGGFLPNQMPVAKYIRHQFDNVETLIKFNSQHYFNKWEVYQRLASYEEIVSYLPDTLYCTNTNDGSIGNIMAMLNKYNTVYLKAILGSNGKQVIRLMKVHCGYEINYFKNKPVTENLSTIEEAVNRAKELLSSTSYIVQQGIDVLQYKERNIDMRALMQRNRKGQWQIVAVPVRIAAKNCSITSTSAGSSCYLFEEALINLFDYSVKDITKLKNEITRLLYTTVQAIEAEYGTFGELGIDIAIDNNGKLWFIECNAKPGKDTIFLSKNEEAYKKSFRLPIQYSQYLTGFTN